MAEACTTESCNEAPVVRVFWPGKSPPPEYCITCAVRMQNVANAIGLTVHAEAIGTPIGIDDA